MIQWFASVTQETEHTDVVWFILLSVSYKFFYSMPQMSIFDIACDSTHTTLSK